MDHCNEHLKEYILKSEAAKINEESIRQNSEYYQNLLNEKDNSCQHQIDDLLRRYARADNFLHILWERIRKGQEDNKFNGLVWHEFANGGKPNPELLHQIDVILQMGYDFQILMRTIKGDEILEKQWKAIVMTMRLAGYDSFDSRKDG